MMPRSRRRARLGLSPWLFAAGAIYAYVRLRGKHFPLDPANAEAKREPGREAKRANEELQANARKAMDMKKAAEAGQPTHPETRTAHEGMRNNPNADIAPSGALDAEGFRPAFGRGGMARGVE